MRVFFDAYFNRFYLVSCCLVFLLIALRAFYIPFTHDEAATFYFYVQNGNYLPYKAHIYTNNHFLNSALSNLLFNLFGSHRFVLRLPNLLAFLLLCVGIKMHLKHLTSPASKLLLLAFFLFTIRFLDFFALCRGYGLSIAFMVLGLALLMNYFQHKDRKHLIYFLLCWQLALAANLVLVVPMSILIVYLLFFQWREKLLFNSKNLLLIFLNLAILAFWIKFSFFYKEQGVLDSGAGDDYWIVTFKSLILWLFGAPYIRLQIILIVFFLLMFLKAIHTMQITGWNPLAFFSPGLFFCNMLSLLIIAFYLQKQLLGVNYPEDRTGIFFYIFFALAAVNFFERITIQTSLVVVLIALTTSLYVFLNVMNISNFYSPFYQTMPKRLFDQLQEEYKKSNQIFTVGGHRVRELNYAFMNYRGGAMLNPMDDSEQMHMNCDYYFAMKRESYYYNHFYNEIGYDTKWDRVLLKRKEPIKRVEIAKVYGLPKVYSGKNEFFEFMRLNDSSLKNRNSLEAEFEICFNKVAKPFKSFLVFSVDNQMGETIYYKRIPLNWLADDLNGQNKFLKLTCGKMPSDFKSLVIYLWNIDQDNVEVSLNGLKLYELHGKGVNFSIPAGFYPLIEKITQKPLL